MEWLKDKRIQIVPPKKPKKITGTRFANILGYNPWHSPFETWCEITRTWEKPYEETKYTRAGKIIEPKQAEFIKRAYFLPELISPSDIWTEDYFNKTYGDFFKQDKVFGGMWDYLLPTEDGKTIRAVFEMKTTKRSEDWKEDIPEYYALQAALYAYLLKVEEVYVVVSLLDDPDYEHPEEFVPSISKGNTRVFFFKVHERYPDFENIVKTALKWWKKHVEGGISPEYDEKRDEEVLKALRTNTLNPETEIAELIDEMETLTVEINEAYEAVSDKEKRLQTLKNIVKEYGEKQFREGDKYINLEGKRMIWTVSRQDSSRVDTKALEADGLLKKYSEPSTTYRLTNKLKEAN